MALPNWSMPAIANLPVARHQPAHTWDAETALPAVGTFRTDRLDLGVHEHGQRDGLGGRVSGAVVEPEDHDPLQHADLDGRKTRAVVGAHGVQHVLHQRMQLRRVEHLHRRRDLAQRRVP